MKNTDNVNAQAANLFAKYTDEELQLIALLNKHEICGYEESSVDGWNHSRPALDLLDENGNAVVRIFDRALLALDDGCCVYDADTGEECDYEEDDVLNAYETHCPVVCVATNNYCSIYNDDADLKHNARKYKDLTNLMNMMLADCVIDVCFKKNGEEIDADEQYQQFFDDMMQMLKQPLDACIEAAKKIRKIQHLIEIRKILNDYPTFKKFKDDCNIHSSWTKTRFIQRATEATKIMKMFDVKLEAAKA